ncbi:hypothetical protein IP84_02035 [beta proteobacterium AAP99]|nr:hypothetical protein IP84_02035 [beta proteobacterium AAP99]
MSGEAQQSGDTTRQVVLALRGVRRDVIAGWITDGATVSLKRGDAGPVECEVTVRGTLVNPAVDRMVRDIASSFVNRCLRS